MKVIFLDIDGVLNKFTGHQEPLIGAQQAALLNSIVVATDAKLVISSTWRNMIYEGHFDRHGFAYMLRTHGINADVIGVTPRNEESDGRGWQIRGWLAGKYDDIERWIVIDDNPDKLMLTMPLVQPRSDTGLTEECAALAIEMLQETK